MANVQVPRNDQYVAPSGLKILYDWFSTNISLLAELGEGRRLQFVYDDSYKDFAPDGAEPRNRYSSLDSSNLISFLTSAPTRCRAR
jgi:hypothetical protein